MNRAQNLLIIGGLALAVIGMGYGLYYALFDEHQTLEGMGIALATGFSQAADGKHPEANSALERYGSTRFEYVREVHAHSHWISLGMVLIALGAAFNLVSFPERIRFYIAVILICGATLFPLGVLLQTTTMAFPAKVIAGTGTVALIGGLATVVWGLLLPARD